MKKACAQSYSILSTLCIEMVQFKRLFFLLWFERSGNTVNLFHHLQLQHLAKFDDCELQLHCEGTPKTQLVPAATV